MVENAVYLGDVSWRWNKNPGIWDCQISTAASSYSNTIVISVLMLGKNISI